ncbi:MAG: GTP 3',8-cyclase MoaA [Thermoanaerobaculia bacterium]
MPLLDSLGRPLRDLRISVTDRCNFRCVYCMPKQAFGAAFKFLRHDEVLTFEEITRIARAFVRNGAGKLRLTGGEPLLRRDLPLLVEMLAKIDGVGDLALTTNGSLLTRKVARDLRNAGLQRITVSLDSLDDEVFRRINDVEFSVDRVLAAIDAAGEAGLRPVKIDAVVKRGLNDAAIPELAERFRWSGHIVRFIEYMDVGNANGWRQTDVVPAREVLETIASRWPVAPVDPAYFGEVAERYRYLDGAGEIGIINSVTQPFCSSCTRARLSAAGRMYLCLFANEGVDLMTPIRGGASDDELAALVAAVWGKRADRYSEIRAGAAAAPKVEMSHIGG